MLQLFSLFLAAFAWATLAVPSSNVSDTSLAPWTTLGVDIDDAARFAASGVSPVEGADIIASEKALFNGKTCCEEILAPCTYNTVRHTFEPSSGCIFRGHGDGHGRHS